MSDAADALWTWSLNVYARAPVKAALLAAQNQFGAHVPLILWAAHAASQGRPIGLDDARAARADIAPISAHTRALRDARRYLPSLSSGGLPGDAREAAIAHIAEAEIALEQIELAKLAAQRTDPAGADPRETLDDNLASALRAAGLDLTKPDPKAAMKALSEAFSAAFTG